MKLCEIHGRFDTDKGTAHSYLQVYEQLFSPRRLEVTRLLEVGVLFGGSLQLWHTYFERARIYGIDDFSHKSSLDGRSVDATQVADALRPFERITLLKLDSRDRLRVGAALRGLTFDIIIDDGSHRWNDQLRTFKNLFRFLARDGVYVVEDCAGLKMAHKLADSIRAHRSGVKIEVVPLNIARRPNDILVIVTGAGTAVGGRTC